jgi:hypothetical protein
VRLGGLGWSWGTCSLDRAAMYDILHCDRNEIISRKSEIIAEVRLRSAAVITSTRCLIAWLLPVGSRIFRNTEDANSLVSCCPCSLYFGTCSRYKLGEVALIL